MRRRFELVEKDKRRAKDQDEIKQTPEDILAKQERDRTLAATEKKTTEGKIDELLLECACPVDSPVRLQTSHETIALNQYDHEFRPKIDNIINDVKAISNHYNKRHPASMNEALPDGIGLAKWLYHSLYRVTEVRHDSHILFEFLATNLDSLNSLTMSEQQKYVEAKKLLWLTYRCCAYCQRTGRFTQLAKTLLIKYLPVLDAMGHVFDLLCHNYYEAANMLSHSMAASGDEAFAMGLSDALKKNDLVVFETNIQDNIKMLISSPGSDTVAVYNALTTLTPILIPSLQPVARGAMSPKK